MRFECRLCGIGGAALSAAAVLVVATMAVAPVGARLAHRLPVATLKRIFSVILILLAAKMVWGLFSTP